MGLFDDFTDFMGEVQSLRSDITQLGTDVVKELVTDTNEVKQVVSDTASGVKTTVQDASPTSDSLPSTD